MNDDFEFFNVEEDEKEINITPFYCEPCKNVFV